MQDASEQAGNDLAEAQRTIDALRVRLQTPASARQCILDHDDAQGLLRMLEQLERLRHEIREEQREWTAAVDAVDAPIFLHDSKFRILRANLAYQRCAGVAHEELAGRPYYEVFPKRTGPLSGCLTALEERGKVIEEEVAVGTRLYLSRSFPVHGDGGQYLYSVHSLEDITERKDSQAQLLQERDFSDSLVETAQVIILVLSPEGQIVRFNRYMEMLSGYTLAEVKGKDWFDMFLPEAGREKTRLLFRMAINDIQTRGNVDGIVAKDGRQLLIEWHDKTLRDSQGKTLGLLAIGLDVTARKQAEARLRASEEWHRQLFESSRDALMTVAPPDWSFTDANRATLKLFGAASVAEFTAVGPWNVSPERQPDGRASAEKALEMIGIAMREGSHLFEWMHQRMDGQTFPADVLLTRMKVGAEVLLQASVRDITERKQHELAMQRANRALRTISEGNEVLIHEADEAGLLEAMCRVAVDSGGYAMARIVYFDAGVDDQPELKAQAGLAELDFDILPVCCASPDSCLVSRAIADANTVMVQDIQSDPGASGWHEAARRHGLGSCIMLPLMDGRHAFGALVLFDAKVNAFDRDEINLLEELAGDLAYGIQSQRIKAAHAEHQQRLQRNMLQTVEAIAGIVEMRDPYTSGHQARVADLARAIARQMGLADDVAQSVHLAGLVHDLGKIRVPAEILSKPGQLDEIELRLIRQHPEAGYNLLKGIDFSWPIAQMVWQHHERMDGSGYPRGLKGAQILLGARILAVADLVEAMSSYRPYRPGIGLDAALAELSRQRGHQLDAAAVDACLTLFRNQDYQFPNERKP